MNTFIDNVATLVIENCLLHDLAGMFSPSEVATWDESKLGKMASETLKTVVLRQGLTHQFENLSAGLKKLKEHERPINDGKCHQQGSSRPIIFWKACLFSVEADQDTSRDVDK